MYNNLHQIKNYFMQVNNYLDMVFLLYKKM